jgi:hypothetical protein
LNYQLFELVLGQEKFNPSLIGRPLVGAVECPKTGLSFGEGPRAVNSAGSFPSGTVVLQASAGVRLYDVLL